MGQWLVFGWFGGWGTSDTQLARRKLSKQNTPQLWWLPLPYGRHGALLLALPHTTISQHATQQVYVVKTREYYCFYYFLAILRHNALSTHRWCTVPECLQVASVGGAESIILSAGGVESMMLSAHAESMDTLSASAESIILSVLPSATMILSALFSCFIVLC